MQRNGSLMVSALVSRSSGLGSRPGRSANFNSFSKKDGRKADFLVAPLFINCSLVSDQGVNQQERNPFNQFQGFCLRFFLIDDLLYIYNEQRLGNLSQSVAIFFECLIDLLVQEHPHT